MTQLTITYSYIIGYYNPSIRITIWFLTLLMLCVAIFYMSARTCNLMLTPKERFFLNVFHGNFLYFRFFAWNRLRRTRRRNIFILIPDLAFEPWHTSNKPTHYLLDYYSLNYDFQLSSRSFVSGRQSLNILSITLNHIQS